MLRLLIDIGHPDNMREWLRGKLARKEKIPGSGHRVYKAGHSRVPTMEQALSGVAAARDIAGWTAHVMEQTAANTLIRPLSAYCERAQRSLDTRSV